MIDPETIRQRNIDISNGRYAAFKSTATLRGKKLQDAFAEAMDQWIGKQQTIDKKSINNKKTVRGINDTLESADRGLIAVEKAFSQALRAAGIQADMLPLVQGIVEDICKRVGESSSEPHDGQTDPDPQPPFDQGEAKELQHIPDKANRHPTRRTKP